MNKRFSMPALALAAGLALGVGALPALAHEGPAQPVAASQPEESHGHKGPHGGEVRTVGQHHVEVAVHAEDGMFMVYVLDAKLKTLPVAGKGRAVVQIAGKPKQTIALIPLKDHYMGLVSLQGAKELIADVSVPVAGKLQTTRFVIKPRPMHH